MILRRLYNLSYSVVSPCGHHKFIPVTHLYPFISFFPPLYEPNYENGWLGRLSPYFLLRRARPIPQPPSNILELFHHRRRSFHFYLSPRTVRVCAFLAAPPFFQGIMTKETLRNLPI